VYNAIKALMIL